MSVTGYGIYIRKILRSIYQRKDIKFTSDLGLKNIDISRVKKTLVYKRIYKLVKYFTRKMKIQHFTPSSGNEVLWRREFL